MANHAAPRDASGGRLYLIGEAAVLTGISADALRKWERIGLLAPRRTAGGVRRYAEDDLARIRLISRTLDTVRLSRRTVAALLDAGTLRPDAADFAPGPARARRSRGRTRGAETADVSAEGASASASAAEEAQYGRRLLDAAARVGQAVASGRPLEEVLAVVCHETCGAFGVSDSVLWLIEPARAVNTEPDVPSGEAGSSGGTGESPALVAVAAYGPYAEAAMQATQGIRVRLDDASAVVAQALRSHRGAIINATSATSQAHPELRAVLPGAALVVVPLYTSDGEPAGALALREALDPERFGFDDLEHARLFATQAAVAIETARLHATIRAAREQAEIARRESAQRAAELQAILDAVPDAIYIYDGTNDRPRTNAAAAAQFALLAQPETHLAPFDLAQRPKARGDRDASAPIRERPVTRFLRGEILDPSHAVDLIMRTLAGTDLRVSITGAPFRDAAGEIVGSVAVARDVTERRRLEEETAARLRELETLIETMADGVGVYDVEGRLLRVNSAGRELFGLAARPGHDHLPLDVRVPAYQLADDDGRPLQREQWPMVRVLRGELLKGDTAMDMRVTALTGEQRLLNISGAPLHDRTGGIAGAVCIFRDVTERRRLEREVAERSAQLEAIFEAMADGVAIYDAYGHIARVNAALRSIMGLDTFPEYSSLAIPARSQRIEPRDPSGKLIPEDQWAVSRLLRGEVLTGRNVMEIHLRTLDGREIDLSLSGAPLRDRDGRIVGAVCINRDVTERRRLERETEMRARQLEATLAAQSNAIETPDDEARPV